MLEIVFIWMLSHGIVEPMGEKNDDRDLYYIYVVDDQKNVRAYDYAYKEEIYNYIATGEFVYEETLTAQDIENYKKDDDE